MGSAKTSKQNTIRPGVDPLATPDWVPMDDLRRVADHAQENPLLYVAGIGAVVLLLVAGGLYSVSARSADREVMTQLARAAVEEDHAKAAQQFATVAAQNTRWQAEALYMQGEEAIRAKDYDNATRIMLRIMQEFAQTEFAPRAADAQAFMMENRGQTDKALAQYQEIGQKWQNDFIARRQPLNIGRCQEKLGDFKAAKAAYEEQITRFPKSHVATDAQAALDKLKAAHPEVFADAPKADAAAKPADAPKADTAATPVPAAPATPAPVPEAAPKVDGAVTPAPAPAEAPAPATPAPATDAAPKTEAPATPAAQ